MTKKRLALLAVEALKNEYSGTLCSLHYTDPLQLLIATRLSAQCTDARVNLVTPPLFARFPSLDAFCAGTQEEIEKYIHSCGLYKTKARDILAMCRTLKSEFGGKVPDTVEKLTKLPGVGRKTANLIVGDIYHKPAVVTDTHCIRICGRLGLSEGTNPAKVEKQLRAVLPPEESNDFCHRLVLHGRAVCTARSPKCEACCLEGFCKSAGKLPEKLRFVWTDSDNPDFIKLSRFLDIYFDKLAGGRQNRKDFIPFNLLAGSHHVLIAYLGSKAVGCAAFREYDSHTAEIKRVFVNSKYRRHGISKLMLKKLESRAKAEGFDSLILQTRPSCTAAIGLYLKFRYRKIPNYGPYVNLPQAVCYMKKL